MSLNLVESTLKVLIHGRQRVTIDVCKVYGEETVFLQQAAHLTGGSYIYLERRDAFLQYLTACPLQGGRPIFFVTYRLY